MPLYSYICPNHGLQERYRAMDSRDEACYCAICGAECPRSISDEMPGYAPFQSYWTEAFPGLKPIRVDSKAQEKKLCKERGFERIS